MKKNRMMRLASVLLILVLLSTSVISGTFAKYTTSIEVNDSARVAYWGFDQTAITEFKLFDHNDATIVSAITDQKVIAPGSSGEASFTFKYTNYQTDEIEAPEVDYIFDIEVTFAGLEDTAADTDKLDANQNFTWTLEKTTGTTTETVGTYQTVALLETAIENLETNTTPVDGKATNYYKAGTLPAGFTDADETYTIGWVWEFETADDTETDEDEMAAQDAVDTAMGNAQDLDDLKITISVTATQQN